MPKRRVKKKPGKPVVGIQKIPARDFRKKSEIGKIVVAKRISTPTKVSNRAGPSISTLRAILFSKIFKEHVKKPGKKKSVKA